MANEILGRKIPFSLEAEQALLGSVLISPDSFDKIADLITAADFYLENHRQIYMAMQSLFLKSRDIDPVLVVEELVKQGAYADDNSGKEYLRTLAEIVPSAANVRDYAVIVRDKAQLRALITICEEVAESAYTEAQETEKLIGDAETRILALSGGMDQGGFVHIRDVLIKQLVFFQNIAEHPESNVATATGFSELDRKLVGMSPGDFIIIGARPGMGKTSFAMNVAVNVARHTKKAVCVFSLEMPTEQIASRLLSSEALVDNTVMRSGAFSKDDWIRLADASATLSECDIYIDDTSRMTITGMRAKLRRMKNVGLIVVDYLQLMQSDRKFDNRTVEVGEISRNLKLLAKEFNVPLICCAQLSRGSEGRTDKRPMLSDLRESGSIEQDADMVMFLYREEYYKKTGAEQEEASVIIAKNRHGSTGEIPIGMIPKYTKFITVSKQDEG